jgi:hypothetical protein
MAKCIGMLAETFVMRGDGYTEDDVWDVHEQSIVDPRVIIRVSER